MRDVAGQQLELGDKVAINVTTGTKAVKMVVGNVLRFTEKGARVVVDRNCEELRGTYFSDATHRFGHIRTANQICFIARDPEFIHKHNSSKDRNV